MKLQKVYPQHIQVKIFEIMRIYLHTSNQWT